MTIDLDALEKLAARIKSAGDDRRYPRFSDMEAASDGLTALIAELKALQAFAAEEIAFAFCAGFNDAIEREKWDDCYDFAASKAGDYRNERIRAFLARNGKGEG